MSTLKTNNIEHLDASTPSIQTTIGGGTILAGVSTATNGLNVTGGSLVVGGTDSSAKLNVFGGDIQIGTGLTFKSSSSTGNLNLQGGFTYPGGWIKLSGGSSDDNIVFGTSSNNVSKEERLRISSNGYVGIGTDNPGYKLDVRPTPSDPTSGSPPAGAFLQIRADDATVGNGPSLSLVNFGGSKETAWRISAVSTSGNNGDLVFNGYAGGATYPEAARFTSAGNLKFPSGQGIDFSATSDGSGTSTSELFDDYEEGTWTPVIKSGTNLISYTGGNQVFRYTKIGDTVHLWFDMDGSTTSGTTGQAWSIEGLPYVSNNTTGYRTVGTLIYWYGTGLQGDAWPSSPHIGNNSTTLQVYQKANAGANYGNTNVSAVGASSYVFFELTYKT